MNKQKDSLQSLWESFNEECPTTSDWDSYGAPPPNDLSLKNAEIIFRALKNSDRKPDRILPTVMGGVNFTFFEGNKYAHIECFNDGEVFFIIDHKAPEGWEVNINNTDNIKSSILKIEKFFKN